MFEAILVSFGRNKAPFGPYFAYNHKKAVTSTALSSYSPRIGRSYSLTVQLMCSTMS